MTRSALELVRWFVGGGGGIWLKQPTSVSAVEMAWHLGDRAFS